MLKLYLGKNLIRRPPTAAPFQPTSYMSPAAAASLDNQNSARTSSTTSTSVPSTNDGSHSLLGIQTSISHLHLLSKQWNLTLGAEHLSKLDSQLKKSVVTLEAAIKAKEQLVGASSEPLGQASSLNAVSSSK